MVARVLKVDLVKAILEPFTFLTSNPGKEIRGKLIEAFNIWLQVPEEKLSVIAKIVNMLHAASLMYAAASFSMDPCLKKLGWMILKMTHSCEGDNQVGLTLPIWYLLAHGF
jgi:hypothetical protein